MAIRPIWNSSLRLSTAFSGEPMSGSSLDTLVSLVACAASARHRPASAAPSAWRHDARLLVVAGIPVSTMALPGGSALELLGGIVGEARTLAAQQRDVAGVRPAAEAIDHVSEAGGGFGEVGRIDLRDVPERDQLAAGAGASDQGLHLLRAEVLCLVENDESVEERAATHVIHRSNLDAVAQQVVGRGAAPVAAFLAARQHLEVVHERAHPRLHLFLLRAGQEADVLTERDGHARHDDLGVAVTLERLHQPSCE